MKYFESIGLKEAEIEYKNMIRYVDIDEVLKFNSDEIE